MTAPTPVPDPTGKRGALKLASGALMAALATALAVGVLHNPPPVVPPPVPIVTATGCPDSLRVAVVAHFADQTPGGNVARGDIAPVVICGPRPLAFGMQTYVQWVAAGPCPCNGVVVDTTHNPYDNVVLSPADTSAVFWDNPDSVLTRADSTHWYLRSTARLRWKTLGGLLYSVMGQALVPGLNDSTPTPVVGWWSYVPFRGGLLRTVLSVPQPISDTAAVVNVTLTRAAQ